MNNTTLDPNSTSSLEPISRLHTTNSLDPSDLEYFFHSNQLETDTEEPEEDFSHMSLQEQAVLSQILQMIKQKRSN